MSGIFDPGSFSPTPLESKCLARNSIKSQHFNRLKTIHQIGAVMRSGENWPLETTSGPLGAGASAQLIPHNSRKQQKNPAAAGSGERFREGKWRRERDPSPTFSMCAGASLRHPALCRVFCFAQDFAVWITPPASRRPNNQPSA